jgi:hypothetical protein
MEYLMVKENASMEMGHLIKEIGEIINHTEMGLRNTKMVHNFEERSKMG